LNTFSRISPIPDNISKTKIKVYTFFNAEFNDFLEGFKISVNIG